MFRESELYQSASYPIGLGVEEKYTRRKSAKTLINQCLLFTLASELLAENSCENSHPLKAFFLIRHRAQ